MTREEYRKKTRKFEPAYDEGVEYEKVDLIKKCSYHQSKAEYDEVLVKLEEVYGRLESNYALLKLLKETKQNDYDINYDHSRKVVLDFVFDQYKTSRKLNQRKEELKEKIKNISIKEVPKEEPKPSEEKIESIEEVKAILNETYNLVLKMQEK